MKKYKFDLTKYFDDDELGSIALILDDFLGTFSDDGVATLDIKDDVHVTMKTGEGPVFHLILDNDDMFTALPKKLSQPKKIASFVISKMEDATKKTSASTDVMKAKADLESKAEDDLLGYMGVGSSAPAKKTDDSTVVVNGKKITDPAEKQKVIDDLVKDYKAFTEKFHSAMDNFGGMNLASDFFNHFFK